MGIETRVYPCGGNLIGPDGTIKSRYESNQGDLRDLGVVKGVRHTRTELVIKMNR